MQSYETLLVGFRSVISKLKRSLTSCFEVEKLEVRDKLEDILIHYMTTKVTVRESCPATDMQAPKEQDKNYSSYVFLTTKLEGGE
jgi:hypothetical protein